MNFELVVDIQIAEALYRRFRAAFVERTLPLGTFRFRDPQVWRERGEHRMVTSTL